MVDVDDRSRGREIDMMVIGVVGAAPAPPDRPA
jgi:hypothetical protein